MTKSPFYRRAFGAGEATICRTTNVTTAARERKPRRSGGGDQR